MSWKDKGSPLDCCVHWRGGHYGGYRFFRHPKTVQEKRLWDREYGRARRSPRQLIDAWEDITRQVQRSWKLHRRTQYKPLN